MVLSNKDEDLGDAYIPEITLSVAYSPDGKYVALASDRSTARILNASTGKELLTLQGHNSTVGVVTFSPDGKRIATASLDGTTRVWDATTGVNLLMLPVAGGSISFSPDGKRLAVADQSGVHVFVVPLEDLVALAKSRVTRTLTTEECRQYLHVEQCLSIP